MERATAIARCSSAWDLTVPVSVTTPPDVCTLMRRAATCGSFNSAVLTRVLIVPSSTVRLMAPELPQAASSGRMRMQASNAGVRNVSRSIWKPSPSS